jgi:hypothetical protein
MKAELMDGTSNSNGMECPKMNEWAQGELQALECLQPCEPVDPSIECVFCKDNVMSVAHTGGPIIAGPHKRKKRQLLLS